jgi:hypothetical protein
MTALALGAGLVSAAHHSGRSLAHVGKKDPVHREHKRQTTPPVQQRSDSGAYLTDKSSSKISVIPLSELGLWIYRVLGQWISNSRCEF